ncbi:mCG146004 [Mus musculus]|nr:mCG146004 [Mus musculus]
MWIQLSATLPDLKTKEIYVKPGPWYRRLPPLKVGGSNRSRSRKSAEQGMEGLWLIMLTVPGTLLAPGMLWKVTRNLSLPPLPELRASSQHQWAWTSLAEAQSLRRQCLQCGASDRGALYDITPPGMVSFMLFSGRSFTRLSSFRGVWVGSPVPSPFFIKEPGMAEGEAVWRDGATQLNCIQKESRPLRHSYIHQPHQMLT